MAFCPACGKEVTDSDARFCPSCGQRLDGVNRTETPPQPIGPGSPAPDARKRRRRRIVMIAVLAEIPIFVVVFFLAFSGKGCGHTEGSFVSKGQPLGDFTFTPTQCRSGQRMSFFGAILVGDGPTEGGLLVGEDAVKGKFVKLEVPGSCKPPDYEVCTELFIERSYCSVFEAYAKNTNTTVNDIRLVDGHLKLDCVFPEGGSVKADIKFENCN
ncbi:MAG: zinc-ribbon domain-containing protein [Myxococcales bacterium]|nr:zinc-ribbon domain-containing protein [Myxococcales bacterium]